MSRPSSTKSAVSSRNPPSRMRAIGGETGVDAGAAESGAVGRGRPACSVRSIHHQPVQRPRHRAQRGSFPDPAQRDGGTRVDVSDVGADGLMDLQLPVRFGVHGGLDGGDQVCVVPAEQLDQAVFLAGELLVERALGRPGVAHDVGDGGVPVAAFADRRGEAVEQSIGHRCAAPESSSRWTSRTLA